MLAAVGHPVAVNPDRELLRVARERGWAVRWFVRPVRLRDRIPRPAPASTVAVGGGLVAVVAAAVTWWWLRRTVRRRRCLRRRPDLLGSDRGEADEHEQQQELLHGPSVATPSASGSERRFVAFVPMRLHQIAQHADDLDRAVAFYRDTPRPAVRRPLRPARPRLLRPRRHRGCCSRPTPRRRCSTSRSTTSTPACRASTPPASRWSASPTLIHRDDDGTFGPAGTRGVDGVPARQRAQPHRPRGAALKNNSPLRSRRVRRRGPCRSPRRCRGR